MSNISPPTTEMIVAARKQAGMSQAEAARTVHVKSDRRWREWESGQHRMPPATFELFLYKTQAVILDVPPMLKEWRRSG